ncbi:hypothetical protein K505DRAFT_357375 [Melanomma pulvis-pyrius CBS 109.77]|uniref:Uncharacterized protein n=1 Tax=Melanomma pulvis-pyrius CBS 109.77 TaxID=1314802 RepID=A0A6A6XR04_9PLEO|nr:hypothetical protein K505DRAFT_357375 [Melanomma pulvis-pyrius CBS 109.77]
MSSNSQLITYNIPVSFIDINVLREDISVYLGPLATVEPAIDDNNGRPMRVYQITAPRKLTPIELEDLEKDTEKWDEEYIKLLKRTPRGNFEYKDSEIHRARMEGGSTESRE